MAFLVFSPVYLQKKCATDKKGETAKNIVKIGNFYKRCLCRFYQENFKFGWVFRVEKGRNKGKNAEISDFL